MEHQWSTVLDEVHGIIKDIRHRGNTPWFRGQSKASWLLTSSLHRMVDDLILESQQRVEMDVRLDILREQFKTDYHTFKADAWPLLEPHQRGEWSLVFHMQHHRIPTRLLDWSESFACALYFAQEDRLPEDAAAIFILDPITLNKKSIDVDSHVALDDDMSVEARAQFMKWHPKSAAHGENLPTVAVSPVITNRRMLAQRAAFTLCGDSFESLESLYPDAVHKVVLPATTFAAADLFLELVGIGPFGYFPDLDGLQRKHKTLLLQQKAMIRTRGSLNGAA